MEENSKIQMEEVKQKEVEVVKDANSLTDSEKEIAEKKEQEKKERIFLFQLIAIFCTWIFLIGLLMRNERKPQPKPKLPNVKNKVNKQIPKHSYSKINKAKLAIPVASPKKMNNEKSSKKSIKNN